MHPAASRTWRGASCTVGALSTPCTGRGQAGGGAFGGQGPFVLGQGGEIRKTSLPAAVVVSIAALRPARALSPTPRSRTPWKIPMIATTSSRTAKAGLRPLAREPRGTSLCRGPLPGQTHSQHVGLDAAGGVGDEGVVRLGDLAVQLGFDRLVPRPQCPEALPDSFAFAGVLTGPDALAQYICHLVGQRDTELSRGSHGRLLLRVGGASTHLCQAPPAVRTTSSCTSPLGMRRRPQIARPHWCRTT